MWMRQRRRLDLLDGRFIVSGIMGESLSVNRVVAKKTDTTAQVNTPASPRVLRPAANLTPIVPSIASERQRAGVQGSAFVELGREVSCSVEQPSFFRSERAP